MQTRLICFGNDIMRDDGAALHVAKALRARLEQENLDLDIVESSVAGYDLLELLRDWERVLLLEAVKLTDWEPGEVIRLDPVNQKTQLRLCSLREAKISEVMAVGRKLGYEMPKELILLGIQGKDLCSFGQELSPEIQQALPGIIERVLAEVQAEP